MPVPSRAEIDQARARANALHEAALTIERHARKARRQADAAENHYRRLLELATQGELDFEGES